MQTKRKKKTDWRHFATSSWQKGEGLCGMYKYLLYFRHALPNVCCNFDHLPHMMGTPSKLHSHFRANANLLPQKPKIMQAYFIFCAKILHISKICSNFAPEFRKAEYD